MYKPYDPSFVVPDGLGLDVSPIMYSNEQHWDTMAFTVESEELMIMPSSPL
jgi:hypothetical protein